MLFLALLHGLASAVSHCHRRTVAVLQSAHFPQTPDGRDLGINKRAHTYSVKQSYGTQALSFTYLYSFKSVSITEMLEFK